MRFPGLHLRGQTTLRVRILKTDANGKVTDETETLSSYAVDAFAGPLEVSPRLEQLRKQGGKGECAKLCQYLRETEDGDEPGRR